ncbi:hypothetical protein R1flu_012909 [Riccia fluitans]|uniref:Uncharacterized protein n=1 Tax=Riccia fluitans TaxID=41844 RepID=A0ABD1ZFD4_9MARC
MISPAQCFEPKESHGADVKHENVVFRILDVLKGMRPGSDLTSFQVQLQFNLPELQLQFHSSWFTAVARISCSNVPMEPPIMW